MGQPDFGWIFEIGGALAFVGFGAYYLRKTIRTRELSLGALIFVACLTMAWQEFYADWGAYLLYNPEFKLLPWGATKWTSPNKPWAVLAGYGWFYSVLFPAMLWVLARLRAARPRWSRTTTVAVVAVPVLYAWNFVSADGVATRFGWWTYADTVGPVLTSSKGSFPLLYPLALFVLFAVVALWFIDRRDDHGRPTFERMTRAHDAEPGWPRDLRRLGAWIVTMNGLYLITLTGPLVVLRELFGDPSSLVP